MIADRFVLTPCIRIILKSQFYFCCICIVLCLICIQSIQQYMYKRVSTITKRVICEIEFELFFLFLKDTQIGLFRDK